MAAQAPVLVKPTANNYPLSQGSRAAFETTGAAIAPALEDDRWYASEMRQPIGLMRSNAVMEAVEDAIGELE